MIVQIKNGLLAARSRQKSYADVRHKPLDFEVGNRVMLKVSPWKGFIRFGKRGKLSPRYIGPFKILSRIGPVAYKLKLPQELHGIHNTFHVSSLKKCLADADLIIPLDEVKIDDKLHLIEEPVEIMDREVMLKVSPWRGVIRFGKRGKLSPQFTGPFKVIERIGPVAYKLELPDKLRGIHDTFHVSNLKREVKRLKQSWIPIVKVRWNSRRGPEFTWEHEDFLRSKYPHLFARRRVTRQGKRRDVAS
uniref:Putative reverse transcriptase domain-containing protein n=1 Tax=Tanacetum cinerariifolium TaxID=118510 RepID=A0A699KBF9_TANCI|nr:putative reverse transcriptase domain-containing protein [Tanacetum cinerariifolium]